MSDYDPISVPSCGGGLNFTKNPTDLDAGEWSWSEGFVAKDGYAEVLPGYESSSNVAISNDPFVTGIFQNPFGWTSPQDPVLVAAVDTDVNQYARLFLHTPGVGLGTEVPWDSVGTQPSGDPLNVVTVPAFLNGYLCMNFGIGPGAVSMIRWDGGASFGGISQAPQAYYLANAAGHLVAAVTAFTQAGVRSVAWSRSNDESTWTPATSNDADDAVLDDVLSAINGLSPLGDNLGIFTRGGIFQMMSTGSIPAFTRHFAQGRGAWDAFPDLSSAWFPRGPHLGRTPHGTIFRGADNFYVAENGQPIASKVFDYWRYRYEANAFPGFSTMPAPQLQWHESRGVLYVPVAPDPSSNDVEALLYDPATGAWSRRALPSGAELWRHACVWSENASTGVVGHRHIFSSQLGIMYIERADGAAAGGEFFDSKDFRLPDPFQRAEAVRIKVDWEPLTNATTDALEILTYWRDDFAPTGVLGSAGKHLDFTSQMVSQGTLSNGQSELDLRGNGKLLRIRFRRSSGRLRVRGFHLYAQGNRSDRKRG